MQSGDTRTDVPDHAMGRRGVLGGIAGVGASALLANAMALGSVGRALAQAPAKDQALRLAYTNPTGVFDTGREEVVPNCTS